MAIAFSVGCAELGPSVRTAPVLGFLRGYLPLPPLPLGARLNRVEPGDGEITVWFDVDDVDEPLTPAIAAGIRRRLIPRLRM